MANNYTQLKIDIQNWTLRNEDQVISTIIAMGQSKLEDQIVKEGIGLPLMETFSSTITPYISSGSNSLPLPSDYLKMIYLQLTDELPSPVVTLTDGGTGALAAGTYYYRVTALNANGESLPSEEKSLTVLINHQVTITWAAVVGATSYNVYGRTTGNEKLIATIMAPTVTYTDASATALTTSMPVQNTSGIIKYPRMSRQTVNQFASDFANSIRQGVTGRPQFYDRVGNTLFMDIYADKDYAYYLRYVKRIAPLSDNAPTNMWTDSYYSALLYSCLNEMGPLLGDDPRILGWKIKRDAEIADIKALNDIERASGSRLLREK